jgi:hypothetical protein
MDQVTTLLQLTAIALLGRLGYSPTNHYSDGVIRAFSPARDLAVFIRPDGSVGDPHSEDIMRERLRLLNAGANMVRSTPDESSGESDQLRENLRHAQRQIDALHDQIDDLSLRGDDRALVKAALSVYEQEIRKACEEDQGNPDGDPDTLGHETQNRLRALQHHPAFRAV